MSDTRLVIFDCDGTLVDGQHYIIDVMNQTFQSLQLVPPSEGLTRGIIGLSLKEALLELLPEEHKERAAEAVALFQRHFHSMRSHDDFAVEPLFSGITETLDTLQKAGYLMAVATGKSMPGLKRVLADHDLSPYFMSLQTADLHPSKPHPSMIEAALADTGIDAANSVIIGDTSFDMIMGVNAGSRRIGVNWGYHSAATLQRSGAEQIVEHTADLPTAIEALFEGQPVYE